MKRILAILSCGIMVALALFVAAQRQVEPRADLPAAFGAIHPRLSPDGKTIAVSYQGALWTVPATGSWLVWTGVRWKRQRRAAPAAPPEPSHSPDWNQP